MYSAQLLDHFQNPRNAGDIADADAAAEIENPACGDMLRVTIKVSAGRIAGAVQGQRMRARRLPVVGIDRIGRGKTLKEAQELRREDVSAAVGGLPQASTHAAQLALDALLAALSQINA